MVVAVRTVWGVIGTKHARFSDFAYSPWAALRYFADLILGRARGVAPVARGRTPQLGSHWTRWLKTTVRAALVGIPVMGLVGGFIAQLTDYGPVAGWIWAGATLPVLIALLIQILASM